MPRPDFPQSILEFQSRFSDEQACLDYLFECRWPDGFVCPRCKGRSAWPIVSRRLWQCVGCRYQASLTAGTVLHKLRRAMINPERTLLTGEVEVDECQVGGREIGRRGGRNLTAKAALVAVAVEVRGNGSGRVRMKVIPNASGETLSSFVAETVVPGAIVHTDGWQGYAPLTKKSYDHRPRCGRAAKKAGDPDPVLPRVHRAISNFKTWLRGTHRSVSNEHLQVYIDEFTLRYNRRGTPMAALQTLLGLGAMQPPTTYRQIADQGPRANRTT